LENRLKILAGSLAVLFFAQVGWWGWTIWTQGQSRRAIALENLELRQKAANTFVKGSDLNLNAWEEVATKYPGIAVTGEGLYRDLAIEESKLVELAKDRESMRRMLFAEGGFFLLVAIGFLVLLFRAIRMEARLSREHARFLHTVTHELRTPLQALKLASETLALENSPGKAKEYAEGMLKDTNRLEAMVDRVLLAGRLEAGMAASAIGPLNLSLAIRSEVKAWKNLYLPADEPELILNIQDDLIGQADPATLTVILGNLLDNALKFGSDKKIEITLAQEGAWVILRVKDWGRGILSADISRIFDRFWRGESDEYKTVAGAGLGLHIVKETAQNQGALVEAQSQGSGHGAEFIVRWPTSEEPLG